MKTHKQFLAAAGALALMLMMANSAAAETNTFTLSGTVIDVVTPSGTHSADNWVPVMPGSCTLTYATIYISSGGHTMAILAWGGVKACATWNHAPLTSATVTGVITSTTSGGAEDVQTILNLSSIT